MEKHKKKNLRGAIFVLLGFAAVILLLYVFFIAKDPALHSGDTGEAVQMGNTASVSAAGPAATAAPTGTAAAATPQPGLSRQISELELARKADVIFLAVPAGEGAACDFYAFQKDGGRWSVAVQTSGFVGREGVKYEDRTENDYTTPGGIFPMDLCFGILPAPARMSRDYIQIDADHYWDGDGDSASYNRLVKASEMPEGWDAEASEHLMDYAEQYRYCMNIGFNKDPAEPGRGFAIFLHCTKTDMTHTAGCVAIPREAMVTCLQMATDNTYIIILQDMQDLTEIEK